MKNSLELCVMRMACVWIVALGMLNSTYADVPQPMPLASGGTVAGVTVAPPEPLSPAGPLDLALGGISLTEQEFYALARKTFYQDDWTVVSANNGAVVAKKHASHFMGFGTVPVNDRLQWDEEAGNFVYRAEMRLLPDKIVMSYLPQWGSTSERLLHNLRKVLATNLY